ncbi:MAG TPA: class II aldolase/adducin family protein [Candidatus Thermoplasmatota archaeon]|nr:class II aldolase/adducin family protein [Candidatus Thermoplasmatota archaeon]
MGVELSPRKFRTFFVGNEPSRNPLVPKLAALAREFGEAGMANGLGSVSARYGKRIVINRAGSVFASMEEPDFVEVVDYDAQRNRLMCMGTQEPCFEAGLHWLLYDTHEEFHGVLHFDDPAILKAQKKTGMFPETREMRPPGSLEWTMEAIKIVRKAPFFLLKNHGCFAVGPTLDEARELAIEAHEAAMEEI